jgi:beta-galactosidase
MSKSKLSRRTFLKATAAATLATQLKPAPAQTTEPWPENGTLIPDEGWYLWIDEHAEWKNDTIFLPDEITRAPDGTLLGAGNPLPINLPTGGWGSLSVAAAKEVVLPTTVEQHFWGKYGSRPYTPEEYRYAADDPIPQNGAYFGVSWWHRQIEIPESMKGKRIFLMEELPFECDLTDAADPGGFNLIAIRSSITVSQNSTPSYSNASSLTPWPGSPAKPQQKQKRQPKGCLFFPKPMLTAF